MRQYGRKKSRNRDPNDRRFSQKLAERISRMDPVDQDRLLHGIDEAPV